MAQTASTPLSFSPKPATQCELELSTLEEGKTLETSLNTRLLPCTTIILIQKMVAEMVGTYFLIFAGCASILVDATTHRLSMVGVAVTWGLVVMVMIYTFGHVSGAHFNPAVTIALAADGRFPWREVPCYVISQLVGSTLASGTLKLLFNHEDLKAAMTFPQHKKEGLSFVWEIIISALLIIVICGVATDARGINELSGVAVGATILFNVLTAGTISGASMNPARSLGPAIVTQDYSDIWIYIVGPIIGMLIGSKVYNLVRIAEKSEKEITKSG